MTQKELLYFEDAIGHEQNLISICDESINVLGDEKLISFFERERDIHNNLLSKLLGLLEDKANE